MFAWCTSTSFVSGRLSLHLSPSPFPEAASTFVNSRQTRSPGSKASRTRSSSLLAPQCTLDGCISRPPRGWTPRLAPLRRLVSLEQSGGVQAPFEQLTGDFVHFLANLFTICTFCNSSRGLITSLLPLVNYLAPPIRSCERGYVSWPNPESLASNQTFPQAPSSLKAASFVLTWETDRHPRPSLTFTLHPGRKWPLRFHLHHALHFGHCPDG